MPALPADPPADPLADLLAAVAADPHNAFVHVDPDRLRADAAALPDGPLHGTTVGVKDLIDVAGMPTRCGSGVLADAAPATADAPVVARLRAAGALIVGKTHTHEFAYGPTGDISVDGPARNPHDPSRITGGSSSGSAAAVAAGLVPLALGTDTGCSVRVPAALCGVVGLKPTTRLLPTDGVFPLSETCDAVGLIGADVATVVRGFAVLTGTHVAAGGEVSGLVVGRPVDGYWRVHDPAIAEGVAAALDALGAAGARIVDVTLPGIDELAGCYRILVGAEAYATHGGWLAQRPQDYQPRTRDRLLAFADQPAKDYVDAQRTRRRIGAEIHSALSEPDVLVLPTAPLRATPIGAGEVAAPDGDTVAVTPALLSLTLPFNLLGWPAVSVPAPGLAGLPAGVQVVGVRGDESTVLRVAAEIAEPNR